MERSRALHVPFAQHEASAGKTSGLFEEAGRTAILKGRVDEDGIMPERFLKDWGTRAEGTAGISIPPDIQRMQDTSHQQGHSLILVAVDTEVAGAIELQPTVRSEAKAVIQGLTQRGITATYIISGDHEAPTRKLATELEVTHYFAETLPARKAELLAELQQQGRSVCYIGDGINDAIALKKAQVSISLRGASSVATDTAQVILMDGRLSHVCELFDLAREYERCMQAIFRSAFFFPVVGVAGVLFLHLRFVFAICMNQMAFLSSLTTAMLPILRKTPLPIGAEKAPPRYFVAERGDTLECKNQPLDV